VVRPLVGVNPPPDRTRPPLRPDVPCETQEPPDLDSQPQNPPAPAAGVDPENPLAVARLERARAIAIDVMQRQLRAQGNPATVGDQNLTLGQIEQQARDNGLFEQLRSGIGVQP